LNSFLKILLHSLSEKYNNIFSELCIVFPSKRACIHFKKEISLFTKKTLQAPNIIGIQDFIAMHSPWIVADDLELVFELYECYKTESKEESFDKFYPWGNMMLNDFDEIDRNLVEADYLFRILVEHKEVEEQFGFTASESEEFRTFWKAFSNKELTDHQKDFINTWEIMGKVYHAFRKRLMDKNICYEGMAYRKIYELTRTKKLEYNYDKIIFAGFNQLNRAEELIIKELVKSGKAELYWDADEYYVSNNIMEAGKFLRSNIAGFGNDNKKRIEDNLKSTAKKINIIGAALQSGQAKALGYFLGKSISPSERGAGRRLDTAMEGNIIESEKTAIVLPDESMLLPVLHSIPHEIKDINVTMGYPFKNSSLYILLNVLKNLHKNKKGGENNPVYYHKDCIDILTNPLLKHRSDSFRETVKEINKRNIIYISTGRLLSLTNNDKFIEIIFQPVSTPAELIKYLQVLIGLLGEEGISVFDKEFFFKLYEKLNHINGLLIKYGSGLEIQTAWKIVIDIMSHVKIPFTGEPLKGLQVMGLLETRSLDFDNVYILSMNEGTVPRGKTGSSYIPYHLRRAFRMPVYEDDDAAFAYYFYRLIQRAKNIYLVYNTESVGLISGEKSRFILQAENELPYYNNKITVNNLTFQASLDEGQNKEIIIQKTDDIIQTLKGRKYSASALSQYIACSLKFYFSKIAQLEKEETAEETFSGASFGSLLHELMSGLYAGYKNKILSPEDIKTVKKHLDENFDNAWETACGNIEEFKEFSKGLYGKNLLYKNVIKKLTGIILENDEKAAPFKILDIEGKIEGEINIADKITLTRRLDRIEDKNGITRIIDYKTGSFNKKVQGNKTISEFLEKVFTEPDYKESFQQYFYAMLYSDKYPTEKVNIGIYPLRSSGRGIVFYEDEDSFITPEKLVEFRNRLKQLFIEIINPDIPFQKTDDIEMCKYCDFRSICYREA